MKVWNIILLVMLLGVAFSYSQVNSERLTALHAYETQQICNAAQQTQNFDTCGKVQDKYNTEFLCNASQCWVEQH